MTLRRLLVALLFAYVTFDLADPLSPGAFTFNPDQSVDGCRFDGPREARPVLLPAAQPQDGRVAAAPSGRPAPARPAPVLPVARPAVHQRRTPAPPPPEPAPAGDDH